MPTPAASMPRAHLGARIATLRSVLDTLWEVAAHTGGEPFRTIGRAKLELIDLEEQLRQLDRQSAPQWPFGALEIPTARVRLHAAEMGLSELARDIAVSRARSLARRGA